MQFAYTAINKDGKTINGVAEATSKQALIALLRKQGIRPVLIKSQKRGNCWVIFSDLLRKLSLRNW